MQEDGCKVSVIIRCRNEEQWVGYSIQSVIDCLNSPEVVIVDNESTDESIDVCRMFEHHVDMKYLSVDNYSPGKALNHAVQHSKHPHVLILSAHCELKSINVSLLRNFLDTYACVFGKQTPCYRGRKIGLRYVWSHFIDHAVKNMISKIENRPFLHNALSFYSKKTLIEFPFNEKLYGKEDRYWAADVINNGLSTYYDPTLWCIHHWTIGGATWKGIG